MTVYVSAARLVKIFELLLLVTILGLLIWSQPWKTNSNEARKITVSGEATLEAKPDEYAFNPYFEATGTDQQALKDAVSAQANAAIDTLKELGVEENKLKLDVSSFDQWFMSEGETGSLQARLSIIVADETLAQKVQDYLFTTEAKGQISPQGTFSEGMKKELETKAVEQAIADAKTKAQQQASLLDAEVGEVLEFSQDQNMAFPVAYDVMTMEAGPEISRVAPPVLVGENEYTQRVNVTFVLR